MCESRWGQLVLLWKSLISILICLSRVMSDEVYSMGKVSERSVDVCMRQGKDDLIDFSHNVSGEIVRSTYLECTL